MGSGALLSIGILVLIMLSVKYGIAIIGVALFVQNIGNRKMTSFDLGIVKNNQIVSALNLADVGEDVIRGQSNSEIST